MHHHDTSGKISELQHQFLANRIMPWEESSSLSRGSSHNTTIIKKMDMVMPFMLLHDEFYFA